MQENRFEQDVQQSLDGLKVRPAAAVWENLERELREKRKRRFFFLFSSLAAGILLLGTAGYFYFSGNDKTSTQEQLTNLSAPTTPAPGNTTNSDPASETRTGKQINPGSPTPAATDTEPILPADASPKTDEQQNDGTPGINKTTKASEEKVTEVPVSTVTDGNGISSGQPDSPAVKDHRKGTGTTKDKATAVQQPAPAIATNRNAKTKPGKIIINDADAKPATTGPAVTPATTDPAVTPATTDSTALAAMTPSKKDSIIPVSSAGTNLPDSTAVVALKKKTTEPAIRWFGNLSAGSTFLASVKEAKADPLMQADVTGSSPVFNSPAISPGLPSNAAAVLPPSESSAGFAFQVSAGVQLKLSTRSSVTAAIGYTYNSSRIRVGEYRNVALQNSFAQAYNISARAYTGYPVKSFTDQYHFISLPLRYQFLINPMSKFRLQWNAGVTPAYMIASDALVYSPAYGGSYVRDNNSFNRFRISAGTGVDLLFGKNGKTRWSLGPEVSVALRRLSVSPYDNQQRFIYTGLSGRLFFGK
ncbi:MAG: hypothetical protein EOO09_11985 [Chitinophagaceae bacterium]|nr:MAG: hypothetical protein EOO09_11985 [Chitinophagaceae bacterium]